MNVKRAEEAFDSPSGSSDSVGSWTPFDSRFDPLQYSKGKSHFQFAFLFVWSSARRSLLDDFYAFCRIADDLVDEPKHAQLRQQALEQLRAWADHRQQTGHFFWDRLNQSATRFGIPSEVFRGILRGVSKDSPGGPSTQGFSDWSQVEEYIEGVAVDVGRGVLSILGAHHSQMNSYARAMGRCVQYINFCRDVEVDWQEARTYCPDFELHKLNVQRGDSLSAEQARQLREIYFKRALIEWRRASAFSWKCFSPELMVRIYMEAALRWWQFGDRQKMSNGQKFLFALKHGIRFFAERLKLMPPWMKQKT